MPQVLQQASDPKKQKHIYSAGYLSNKTIAALCTPTGGALCVLRVSGSQAIKIAEKISNSELLPSDDRKAQRI